MAGTGAMLAMMPIDGGVVRVRSAKVGMEGGRRSEVGSTFYPVVGSLALVSAQIACVCVTSDSFTCRRASSSHELQGGRPVLTASTRWTRWRQGQGSWQDGQNSVKSLLALLQSTQDGGSATPPDNDAPAHHNPRHAQHGSSSSYDPHRPGQTSSYAASYPARPISSVNPTQRQLDDLLASLKNPPPATSSSSAFDGSRNSLIEPFGPIGKRARQEMGFDPLSLGPAVPASDAHAESSKPGHSGAAHASRRGEKEWDEMGYTRALPIISELLEDEGFTKELKRVGLANAGPRVRRTC